jgi:hypothetical protein
VQIASDINRFIRSSLPVGEDALDYLSPQKECSRHSPLVRSHTSLTLGCSHPINRTYVIREGTPRRRYLITNKERLAPSGANLCA